MGDPFSVLVVDDRTRVSAFVEAYRTLVAGVLDILREQVPAAG